MAMQQRLDQSKSLMPMTKPGKMARREAREFYLFVLPWLIGLILFDFGPILASFGIGFTDWSLLEAPKFVGLGNYVEMFQDPLFFTALWNSAYYGFWSVGLGLIVSFSMALLLNQKVVGMSLFRTIFYLPSIVTGHRGCFVVGQHSASQLWVD